MENKFLLSIVLLSFFIKAEELITVDKMVAEVFYLEDKFAITESELTSDLEGKRQNMDHETTIKDVARESVMLEEAARFKIVIDDATVDRTLARIQEASNITRDQLIDMLKEMGLTYEQAREEVKKNLTINNLIDGKVRSKVFVDEKEVEEANKANPMVHFFFQEAFIPGGDKEKIQKEVDKNRIDSKVSWSEAFEIPIKLKDLEEDRPVGLIEIFEDDNGVKLRKVADKFYQAPELTNELKMSYKRELYGKKLEKNMQDFYSDLDSSYKIKFKSC